jgi:hypothetical protein
MLKRAIPIRRSTLPTMAAFVAYIIAVGTSIAAEETDAAQQAEVSAMVKAVAADCRFSWQSKETTPFVQNPEPILRWSNPTVGSIYGDVYLWTDHGRPVVVAGAYRSFSHDWGDTMEVCSLADRPVIGQRKKEQFWKPKKPGIEFQSITDIDVPAKTAAARLTQMRRIADGFVAELQDTRGTNSGIKRQLRMLSRPIFRYPTAVESSNYLDGTLFVFVEGTDPEVLLQIEAVTGGDKPVWQFGVARMNRDELQVRYRDQVVWSAPYINEVMGRIHEPYALFVIKAPGQNKSRITNSETTKADK